MSKLTTFRMPDAEAAAVAKECERREIGLTTAMMEAVRKWLSGAPAVKQDVEPKPKTVVRRKPAHMPGTVPVLKRKAFNPQPKKR